MNSYISNHYMKHIMQELLYRMHMDISMYETILNNVIGLRNKIFNLRVQR